MNGRKGSSQKMGSEEGVRLKWSSLGVPHGRQLEEVTDSSWHTNPIHQTEASPIESLHIIGNSKQSEGINW